MSTYKTIARQVEAEQFDGAGVTGIAALAGEGNISFTDGRLQVRVTGGYWEDVLAGWWVTREAGGYLGVLSPAAFGWYWEEADGFHAGA